MKDGNYIRFDWAIKRLLRDKANVRRPAHHPVERKGNDRQPEKRFLEDEQPGRRQKVNFPNQATPQANAFGRTGNERQFIFLE